MYSQARQPRSSSPAQVHGNTTGVSVIDDQLRVALEQIYWAALGVCILVIPLTTTGIREYGVSAFLVCSLLMGATWAARHILFATSTKGSLSASFIGVLAIGLVALQLQPLPQPALMKLAPFIPKYMTLWEPGTSTLSGPAGWQQITMTPEATRSGLVLLIAYVIFFVTLLQHLQSQADVDRLMKFIGSSAVLMAAVGIGQALFGNDKFLWMFEHPTRAANWPAKGTFHNQNHFAQFLALGLGPLVWWWYSAQHSLKSAGIPRRRSSKSGKRRRTHSSQESTSTTLTPNAESRLVAAGTAIVGLAAILSFSRGGIASFLLAAVVVATAVLKQWKAVVRYVIPAVAFVGCGLAAFGTDRLTQRWNQLRNATSLEEVDTTRWTLWEANADAIAEFWPAGSGVGSHADVYPIWMTEQFGVRFSHAESGYIQVFLETGLPGLTLLVLGILTCSYWCIRGGRRSSGTQRVQTMALAASLLASFAHSVVDFVWYIPACMIQTLAIAACACRCHQLLATKKTRQTEVRHSRLSFVTACILLLTVLPTGQLFADTIQRDLASVDSWKAYRIGIRASVKDAERGITDTLNEHLDTLIDNLEQCAAADPFHHEVHTALAPLYLQRFEHYLTNSDNQLTLNDIRDTVRDSAFATQEALRTWLEQVCGDHLEDLYRARHSAMQGLRNRPLRGESYVILAETGFLNSQSDGEQQALIQQAVRLRPNEPRVLYAAGLLAEDSGDTEAAWTMWRHAANLDPHIGRLIVQRHIDLMTVTELIEKVAPTPDSFGLVYHEYKTSDRTDDLPVIAAMFADKHAAMFSQSVTGNSSQLSQYAMLFLEAKRSDLAVRCLKRAALLQPKRTAIRMQLAKALAETDDLEGAHQELAWLHLTIPNDQRIAQLLQDIEQRMQPSHDKPDSAESPVLQRVNYSRLQVSEHQPEPTYTPERFN